MGQIDKQNENCFQLNHLENSWDIDTYIALMVVMKSGKKKKYWADLEPSEIIEEIKTSNLRAEEWSYNRLEMEFYEPFCPGSHCL